MITPALNPSMGCVWWGMQRQASASLVYIASSETARAIRDPVLKIIKDLSDFDSSDRKTQQYSADSVILNSKQSYPALNLVNKIPKEN